MLALVRTLESGQTATFCHSRVAPGTLTRSATPPWATSQPTPPFPSASPLAPAPGHLLTLQVCCHPTLSQLRECSLPLVPP